MLVCERRCAYPVSVENVRSWSSEDVRGGSSDSHRGAKENSRDGADESERLPTRRRAGTTGRSGGDNPAWELTVAEAGCMQWTRTM